MKKEDIQDKCEICALVTLFIISILETADSPILLKKNNCAARMIWALIELCNSANLLSVNIVSKKAFTSSLLIEGEM